MNNSPIIISYSRFKKALWVFGITYIVLLINLWSLNSLPSGGFCFVSDRLNAVAIIIIFLTSIPLTCMLIINNRMLKPGLSKTIAISLTIPIVVVSVLLSLSAGFEIAVLRSGGDKPDMKIVKTLKKDNYVVNFCLYERMLSSGYVVVVQDIHIIPGVLLRRQLDQEDPAEGVKAARFVDDHRIDCFFDLTLNPLSPSDYKRNIVVY